MSDDSGPPDDGGSSPSSGASPDPSSDSPSPSLSGDSPRRLSLLIQAVESARDAILILKADTASRPIVFANASLERIFGYSEDEATREPVDLLTGPETASSALNRLRQAFEAGEAATTKAVLHRRDGSPVAAEWSVAPVRDTGGRPTHWVSVVREISEQQALKREIVDISEEERRRIGRALHDVMAPNLTAATFILERVIDGASAEGGAADGSLEQVLEILRAAAGKVRDLSHLLSPVEIESHGLAQALRRLAGRIGSVAAVEGRTEVQADPGADLACVDDDALVHLYRIAEEAAHNAAHHADPSQITIRLEKTGDTYVLEVEDDGAGIAGLTGADDLGAGTGLDLMRYRAQCVDGAFDIDEREGGGTVVRCAVPAAALEASSDA